MTCKNNLKQIALALHNYHQANGCFPPAYIADKNGRPMHSWRVLILPYLELDHLYKQYNFNEPWDGPNNKKLLAARPKGSPVRATTPATQRDLHELRCRGRRERGMGGRESREDCRTPTEPDHLVVEVAGADIPWTEPTRSRPGFARASPAIA